MPTITFDRYYSLKYAEKFKYLYNDVFQDDFSEKTLKNILLAAITGESHYYNEISVSNQYYCIPEFMHKQNEYVAEIGAFVGDSLEKFIWATHMEFKKIYAFEPAKRQFKALQVRVKRLNAEWALEEEERIVTINAAVGEYTKKLKISKQENFENFNINFPESKSFEFIDLVSIDDYFKDNPISFIKADIEGMEIAMLQGAKQTILKNKPKIAICVYHNINDLIDIVEFLHNIVPQYKMALRHHSSSSSETVLYCWKDA